MGDYAFSGYHSQFVAAFLIAAITSSFGSGFQYQGFIYVLVTVFATFTTEQFFTFTLLYCITLVISALARITRFNG